MRRTFYNYKQLVFSGLELFGLFAVSGLISLYFPQWIPNATHNPTQREWASVFSAISLLACAISLRALSALTKAYAVDRVQWQQANGPRLKWASMLVDATAFFWSTRACTNRDTAIVTVAIGVAYLGFPRIMRRFTTAGRDDRRYALIITVAAIAGLACELVSCAITDL